MHDAGSTREGMAGAAALACGLGRRGELHDRPTLKMLRKEMAAGYVVAGFLAVLVPVSVWNDVFLTGHGFWTTLENVIVGPFIALISFVCSIGNVPLAAALWHGGISFGGVISFIFADLIALPLLLIYRKYYGGRLALRCSLSFWVVMGAAGLIGRVPLPRARARCPTTRPATVVPTEFSWNYTTFLNIVFLLVLAGLWWLARNRRAPRRRRRLRDRSRLRDAGGGGERPRLRAARRPDLLLLLGPLPAPLRGGPRRTGQVGAAAPRLAEERVVHAPLEGGDQLLALRHQPSLHDGPRVQPALHRLDEGDILRRHLRVELDRLLDPLGRHSLAEEVVGRLDGGARGRAGPSARSRRSAVPGEMLIVVLGQRKWYWDWRMSPERASSRSGPTWLKTPPSTESRYESGSTSITLLNPGCATGQW